jgi:2-polyprenyl-3-methyl-5-hydroxy-6-metoxy-1,4-benzoquinol methylase
MADFRDKLYEQYFHNQSGRRLNKDLSEKIKENWKQLNREILPLLPTDKKAKILDIGCGYGEWLMLMKENNYTETEGVDISREQIETAHTLGITNVQVADVFDYLAQKKNYFDCITGIDIIEHFSKDELVNLLELIKGALKANGTAIFRTPNMDGLLASVYAYGDFTHSCLLNYSSAQQLGLSCGFSKVEVLPSFIYVNGALKEMIRRLLWWQYTFTAKLVLFASGRSSKGVLFTPNLLLVVGK